MLCLQLLSSSLRHLDISGNTLENLQGVEQLYNLTWLDAGHNALQASGTRSLSGLRSFVNAADAIGAYMSNICVIFCVVCNAVCSRNHSLLTAASPVLG